MAFYLIFIIGLMIFLSLDLESFSPVVREGLCRKNIQNPRALGYMEDIPWRVLKVVCIIWASNHLRLYLKTLASCGHALACHSG